MDGIRMVTVLGLFLIVIWAANPANCEPKIKPFIPTVTVRGFLNFRTTVDNTVIVFTSSSEAAPPASKTPLQTKALDSQEGSEIQELSYTQLPDKNPVGLYKLGTDLESDAASGKNSFSHISDNVVVPPPPSIVSGRTQQSSHRTETSQPQYPTGLVTVLEASRIDKDVTTVYETKVIGTYIDGKYAQILQSTSKIVKPSHIISSSIPTTIQKSIPITEKSLTSFTEKSSSTAQKILPTTTEKSLHTNIQQTSSVTTEKSLHSTTEKTSSMTTEKFSQPITQKTTTPSSSVKSDHTFIQSSFEQPVQTTQNTKQTQTTEFVLKTTTRPVRTSTVQIIDEDNKVQTSQQNRRTSSRYRFVHPRRETQTVRLNRFKVKLSRRPDSAEGYETTTTEANIEEEEDEEETTIEEKVTSPLPPVNPARVVYQLTTVTSEVTLHVGRRKSVRTLTITTTVERILQSTDEIPDGFKEVPSSGLAEIPIMETPPLVLSSTYSITEKTWKTSLVPVFDGLSTVMHTVTESLHILKLITAYKTLPPGDITLLDFEQNPEAATIDENIEISTELPTETVSTVITSSSLTDTPQPVSMDTSYVSVASSSSLPVEYSNPLLSLGAALNQNPLAAVYLGLQQLNRQVTLYSTVTKTSSYVTTDTIYSTKTVRYYDGRSTRFRKISEPVSTNERTITTTITSVEPYLNTHSFQQQQQHLQQLMATQIPLAPPTQYSTITSSYTTVTTATSYSTRVYTLIYNAISTKYRTVTSTSLYPTTVTLYSTKEVPISSTIPSVQQLSSQ